MVPFRFLRRNEQILPNFYFSVPWRIFIRIVELADSSVEVRISRVTLYRDARSSVRPRTTRRVTVVGTHGRASVVSKETASVVSKVTASWF